MKNWCYNATVDTGELIGSDGYPVKAKRTKNAFSRKRKLSLVQLTAYLLSGYKEPSSLALERFCEKHKLNMEYTQQALSEARQKLNPEAIKYMFEEIAKVPYRDNDFEKHYGHRVLAIDGTTLALPTGSKELLEYYGCSGRGLTSPTAHVSILYDVGNDVVLDGTIGKYRKNERTMAREHLKANRPIPGTKDLFLFDRGYPSYELIGELNSAGYAFVMRVRSKFDIGIDDLQNADNAFELRDKTGKNSQKVRVLKFALSSGEQEVLLSNVFDETLTIEDFKKLYALRWDIEKQYDKLKNKLQLENFTGRTVVTIEQDFYVSLYLSNMAAYAKHDAEPLVAARNADNSNKYTYKVNVNHAIGLLKDSFVVALLLDNKRKKRKLINTVIRKLAKIVVPIRDDRHFPRPVNIRKCKYHFNRKSAL